MFNWHEMETWAMSRLDLGDGFSEADRQRLCLLQELESLKKPLKARLGAALVRLGARLDPERIHLHEAGADEALIDGRLAAYLR